MGNGSTSLTEHTLVRTYRPEEWLKQALDQNGQLMRNKFSHQLVKLYPLQKVPSIEDMHRYQLRSTHQYLVKVFNIAMYQHASVCHSNQSALLMVEHIPLKLNEVGCLDLEESLTVLHSSFQGFHTIESLFQLVQPQEELIGFNDQGKTKVWLNRQLNNNYIARQSKPNQLSQFSRVIKILEMVHRKIPASRQFYNLRQQILQHNVNYFQASIIVEEFAFREELSLKRYVRMDLLTRQANRPEVHRRKTTVSTIIPTQRSHVSGIRKSEIIFNHNQLQKVNSWDKLIPVRASYIIKNQPLRPNQQQNSRLTAVGSSPSLIGSKSIPKITFNRNNELIGSPKFNETIKPKIVFGSPKVQQKIVFFTKTNSVFENVVAHVQQKQQQIKQNEQKKEVQQKQNLDKVIDRQEVDGQKKEEEIVFSSQAIMVDINSESMVKVEDSPVARLQFSQKKHSIIDECEKYLEESKLNQPQKQIQEQHIQVIQNASVEDVQQSGMFRQIDDKQVKDQSELIQQTAEAQPVIVDIQIAQQVQPQNKQIPINFQSFAIEKTPCVQNVSFAPNLTQNNFQNENLKGTTKSLDFEEKQEEHESEANSQLCGSEAKSELCQSQQHIEEPPKKNFRLVESQQRVENKHKKTPSQQPVKIQNSKSMPKNQLSLELYQQFSAICQQQKPFYEAYTPVESKFDIVIKRDSAIEKEREATDRSNKLSAFGNIEQDQGYEKSIKNKFKQMYPAEELRINRISSEYYTKTKKNHDSSRQAKPQPKAIKISNINEGTQQDFLDINHLQKTLQMKCSKKVHKKSDDFDVSKLEEKLLKFSSSRGQIGSQNSKRQSTQTYVKSKQQQRREDRKQTRHQSYYKQTIDLSKDHLLNNQQNSTSNRYRTYNNNYDVNMRQYDKTTRNNYKYNSYSYNRYPDSTQQYLYTDNRYDSYQRTDDIYDKYGSNSYNRYTDTLPQNSKIKKQSSSLLEERYQKYVKSGKQKASIYKQKSVDTFSKNYQTPQKNQPSPGKRISYDNLRQFLWN